MDDLDIAKPMTFKEFYERVSKGHNIDDEDEL